MILKENQHVVHQESWKQKVLKKKDTRVVRLELKRVLNCSVENPNNSKIDRIDLRQLD